MAYVPGCQVLFLEDATSTRKECKDGSTVLACLDPDLL